MTQTLSGDCEYIVEPPRGVREVRKWGICASPRRPGGRPPRALVAVGVGTFGGVENVGGPWLVGPRCRSGLRSIRGELPRIDARAELE